MTALHCLQCQIMLVHMTLCDATGLSALKWEAFLQRQDMIEAVRAAASAAATEGHMQWGPARDMLSTYQRLLDSDTYLSF